MPEEYLNRCCSITSQIKGNFICIFGKMQEGSFVKYRRGITLEQPVFLKSYNKDPELNDPVRSHVRKLCDKKTEEIMALAETSGFRPRVDVKFLIQEIEGFFLITLWQIFSQGKWDVNYLEKNFTKRIEQWKAVYLKEN